MLTYYYQDIILLLGSSHDVSVLAARGISMKLSDPAKKLVENATLTRELGALVLSLSLLSGCSPSPTSGVTNQTPTRPPARTTTVRRTPPPPAPPSDGINRAATPSASPQLKTTTNYLATCEKLQSETLRFSRLLDEMNFQTFIDRKTQGDFLNTLKDSYQNLLHAEKDPSLSPRAMDALTAVREQLYIVYRTADDQRLSARSGNSTAHHAVDGNSEILYELLAKLDTAILRLTPGVLPTTK